MSFLKPIAHGLAALCLASGLGQAASVTTSFDLYGAVGTPGTYTAATLGALPQSTQTLTFLAGSTPVTDTYTGPTLWNLLQHAGGATVDPSTHNGLLRDYAVVTASDGYKAVVTLGEIAPSFGNKPYQTAIGTAAGKLPSPDGFARLTAAGDVKGGRYVSNIFSIQLGIAPLQAIGAGGPSSSIHVQGGVATPLTFDLAALQAMPSVTVSGFTGPLLWNVLNRAGIDVDLTIKNDILRKVVVATGSDGYQVAFSLGEIAPGFGNQQIIVAYADGNGLLAGNGFARIIVPGDVQRGRYVSNLTSLTIFDPTMVPEPASLALLLVGLGGLALRRRASSRA